MNDIDEIRKRKLAELQHSLSEQVQKQRAEEVELSQQVEQMEAVVKQRLSGEALTRFGAYKTAFPEQSIRLIVVLYQLIVSKQPRQITDDNLKMILRELQPEKREIKITRK